MNMEKIENLLGTSLERIQKQVSKNKTYLKTMELQTITIKEYLNRKDIAFRERGKELIAHCLFNGCDDDSRGNEAHLYFSVETGQYECKKCGEKGNLVTLANTLETVFRILHLTQSHLPKIHENPRSLTPSWLRPVVWHYQPISASI